MAEEVLEDQRRHIQELEESLEEQAEIVDLEEAFMVHSLFYAAQRTHQKAIGATARGIRKANDLR
jgi:hypothetical protein